MCACEPGYLCHDCAGTRHDPAYFDPANDVLGFDPLEAEPDSPSEYEVVER